MHLVHLEKVFLLLMKALVLSVSASKKLVSRTPWLTEPNTVNSSFQRLVYFFRYAPFICFYIIIGLGQFIGGAICFEETLFANAEDGTPLVELLHRQGIIPGIKVDMGTVVLPGTDGETVTQGIDKLGERCAKYYAQGARFSKWRAVIKITDSGCPSQLAINQNAETLARYAAISQQNGLVPIVEPEVLMDGPHSIHVSAEVSERVYAACFKQLSGQL